MEAGLKGESALDSGMGSVRGGVLSVGKIIGQVERDLRKLEAIPAWYESCK